MVAEQQELPLRIQSPKYSKDEIRLQSHYFEIYFQELKNRSLETPGSNLQDTKTFKGKNNVNLTKRLG